MVALPPNDMRHFRDLCGRVFHSPNLESMAITEDDKALIRRVILAVHDEGFTIPPKYCELLKFIGMEPR